MSREAIDKVFAHTHQVGRLAFMPYLTAGYPTEAATRELGLSLAEHGADLLELGVPFSDPLGDGPTIQRSSSVALAGGMTVRGSLALAAALSASVDTPLVLMGYYNPLLRFGLDAFCAAASSAGVSALIVPDLPVEESTALRGCCRDHDMHLIYLLAPTSTEERIITIAEHASGFVYCMSVAGVTGARERLADDLGTFLSRVRAHTALPLVVGFGISRQEHLEQLRGIADGAVVASALVDLIDRSDEMERSTGRQRLRRKDEQGMLRFLTAGESHGPQLTVIIDGVPAGLPLTAEDIDGDLRRRQGGHGRSERQKMEHDHAQIVGGVRGGLTLGSPIALVINNRVWEHWQDRMHVESGDTGERVTAVRPGHADLAGALKYGHTDVRNVLERASARETAARVAAGAVARLLLHSFDIEVRSHTLAIGSVRAPGLPAAMLVNQGVTESASFHDIWSEAERSPVRCSDAYSSVAMVAAIDEAKRAGVTLGGTSEIIAYGVPIGLGSHVQWDRKLDGRLAQVLMSIQSVKGVEIGPAFENTLLDGSAVHDIVEYRAEGWRRSTNRAGGLEGGISNGEPLIARIAVKPISTMRRALPSADLVTGEQVPAHYERSDTAVVPAAGVIGEAMVAWVVADALMEKCGGDSVEESHRNYEAFVRQQRARTSRISDGPPATGVDDDPSEE